MTRVKPTKLEQEHSSLSNKNLAICLSKSAAVFQDLSVLWVWGFGV